MASGEEKVDTCPNCRRTLDRHRRLREQGHADDCTYVAWVEKTVAEAPPLSRSQVDKIRTLFGL